MYHRKKGLWSSELFLGQFLEWSGLFRGVKRWLSLENVVLETKKYFLLASVPLNTLPDDNFLNRK